MTLRESIPRLFYGGKTTMTTRCAPAWSQALPVKPQGGLGQKYWSVNGVTWPPTSGVSEVGVFRALQPNEIVEFSALVTLKFDGSPPKTIGHLLELYYVKLCASFQIHRFKQDLQSGNVNSGQNCRFFVPCDLEIWCMILENKMAPLLYYKLCASFQIHRWIQTGVTVRKR